jgi:hypothetical protein
MVKIDGVKSFDAIQFRINHGPHSNLTGRRADLAKPHQSLWCLVSNVLTEDQDRAIQATKLSCDNTEEKAEVEKKLVITSPSL